MANDNTTDLNSLLGELRGATSVVLMLVPYRTSFRARIGEAELPNVSCVYEVTSSAATFNEVLRVVETDFVLSNKPKSILDLRIGIVFKRGEKDQGFYFSDTGGFSSVHGFIGERDVIGSPELPKHLRELVTHQDVVLIRDHNSRCPRA